MIVKDVLTISRCIQQARIESRVDLPQPEGPAMETYSPCLMSSEYRECVRFNLVCVKDFLHIREVN